MGRSPKDTWQTEPPKDTVAKDRKVKKKAGKVKSARWRIHAEWVIVVRPVRVREGKVRTYSSEYRCARGMEPGNQRTGLDIWGLARQA